MPQRQIYSFSSIVSRMTNMLSSSTGISDFTPGSIIRTMLEVIAVFVEYLQFLVEAAFRSFYMDTSAGEDLDNRVEDFSLSRRESVASNGIQTFISSTPAAATFIVSAGTQVSTQPDVFGNTISFTVDDDITFLSGALTATGNITCEIFGIEGNVGSGTITNIPTSIAGVTSTINYYALSDGSTEESDDQLRKRVPVHLIGLQKGNEDGIKAAISAIGGITLVKMEENSPSNGEVTVYVSNESGVLSQAQLDAVEAAAEGAASFGIEVSVVTPDIQYITIALDSEIDGENYDVDFIKEDIRDSIDERVRTNPASDLLIYDLILASTVQGVNNIRNVKINGVTADLVVSGFKVIRLNDPTIDIVITLI